MKDLAVICDLDGTLCVSFDEPIESGCTVLRSLTGIQVHYVTARPEASRRATTEFLDRCRLPYRANVHFCPDSKRHNVAKLARDFAVLVSIGDSDEDRDAAHAAGTRFVRICRDDAAAGWAQAAARIREAVNSAPPC